jgi:putative endonuclease
VKRVLAVFGPRVSAWFFEEPEHERYGRMGEDAAAELLRASGYRVLERNVRVPMGEADIVCEAPRAEAYVIVEVKTRVRRGESELSDSMDPAASVTAEKRRKLSKVASWLARCNGWRDRPVRIDVVTVEFDERRDAAPVMRHLVGAVKMMR